MCASFARSGRCTVLIITHKFREVMAYADDVTVLRRGKAVHHCTRAPPPTRRLLAQAMVGDGRGKRRDGTEHGAAGLGARARRAGCGRRSRSRGRDRRTPPCRCP